jgi:LPS-assembly protein
MRDAVGETHAAARARSKARLAAGGCIAAIAVALPEVGLAQSIQAAQGAQTAESVQPAPAPAPSLTPAPSTEPAAPPAPAQTPAPDTRSGAPLGPPHLPDRNAHGPVGEDRLAADELYVEADAVTRDDAQNLIIARGNVLARYQNHTLRAQELVYNTATGGVTANGHAEIVNPDGTVEYGEHVEMDDKLKAGFVTGFAATQTAPTKPGAEPQVNKVAAAAAIRRNEDVNELRRVVFTACGICTPQGRPTQPTWSIQAEDAVQDKPRRLIVYRNAVLKVKGVPIFWAPVFWTPDPTAPRQSGLLPPRLLNTQRLGFSWEQPYLWVISPSQDLEFRPQVNTNVAPLLNLWWRKRFYSGEIDARVGYTYERYFDNNGTKFGNDTSHSYVLAGGAFNIDNNWRWGFSGEHSSDPTFFDRYDIQNIYEHRGLYWDDTRVLSSQLYAVRQDSTSFLSMAAINFQSLVIYDQTTADGQPVIDPTTGRVNQSEVAQSALPNVAPLIDARWDPDVDILNGRLRMFGSAVLLDRGRASQNPFAFTTATDPCFMRTSCPGVSDERASVGAEWRSYYTVAGLRIEPFLDARGDLYGVESGLRPTPGIYTLPQYPNATIGRALGNLGVDLSYPLYRPLGGADLIIEPMAEIVISPKANLDQRIPNEDSQVVTFDETDLFRPDRFPGYDLYEGGARASIGAMATLNWGASHNAQLFLGRAFRSENDLAFPAGSGLRDRTSDWIVYASAQPIDGLNAWTRERFDGQTGALRRAEAAVNWNVSWTHGIARYLNDDTGLLALTDPSFVFPLEPQGRREQAESAGYALATRHWGVTWDAIYDLRNNVWQRSEGGILYRDVCIDVALVYQRNETNPLGPSSTVLLRLNFPMAGTLGFLNYENR